MSQSQDFFDRPETLRRILFSLYVICGLLFGLDFIIHRHTEHPLEGLYGFYPIYGFIGCVVLVIVASWMRKVIMRDENYYQQASPISKEDNHAGD